jgi:hypothetical protein
MAAMKRFISKMSKNATTKTNKAKETNKNAIKSIYGSTSIYVQSIYENLI